MEERIVLSGWKTVAFGAVAVGCMLIGVFRLDELIARRKSGSMLPKRTKGHDRSRRMMFSDPDGKEWKSRDK